MSTILTSAALRTMKSTALKQAVRKAVTTKPAQSTKARVKELHLEIKGFETKHKMTTKEMLNKLCSGDLSEGGEIETWLIKYNLLCMHEKA